MISINLFSRAVSADPASTSTESGPLRVLPSNPRYFTDGSGKAILLSGSHTWANLQDNGGSNPPPAFDYTAYLNFLQTNNHNFFRLWTWEQARWTLETSDTNYRFSPMPFARTGPGTALDGLPKFDLTQFNQVYFDRLRSRIIEARDRGMYVSIMLFDGWSIDKTKGPALNDPWKGHPFNSGNNINGINGDPNNDGSGKEVHTLAVPAITTVQKAYIARVIDTVNDLDNVLYEISNESYANSTDWQYALINYIHQYEASLPKQHPVGMTFQYPDGSNTTLLNSPADWISPNNQSPFNADSPGAATGQKVILYDTDHLCGICGYNWFDPWKSFTRGYNPIYMDVYDGAGYGVGANGFNPTDADFVKVRKNLGYIRSYADWMNLAGMVPHGELSSTGYALANPAVSGAEYLIYQPSSGTFTVNLSSTIGSLTAQWLNPSSGAAASGGMVAGGATHSFTPPFSGSAVLYLTQSVPLPEPTPTRTHTSTTTIQPAASLTPTKTATLTQTKTVIPPKVATPTQTKLPSDNPALHMLWLPIISFN